jgi:hypothetical protein
MAEEAAVAPEQGGEATESGDLYDLNSVDPEYREQFAPHLKAVQSKVEKQFRDHAELRKGWEPYEELGLRDMDPTAVKQLIDFASMANDPEQFDSWLKTAAEERGLFNGNGAGDDDLSVEELEELSPEKIKEIVAEQIKPLQDSQQQQVQAQAVAEAEQGIEDALGQIRKDNPDLPENAEDAIVKLAYAYAEEDGVDPIAKGFEDYQNLIGQGEKGLFEQKTQQPPPAEGAGAAAMGDEKITSFDDPKLRARVLQKVEQTG